MSNDNRTLARAILQAFDELFQQSYPFSKSREQQTRYGAIHSYRFTTQGGRHFEVEFDHRHPGTTRQMPAEVAFMDVSNPDVLGKMDITNAEGQRAQKVFSTVHEIIKEHLRQHPYVNRIDFSAVEPSRRRLYTHLVKRLTGTDPYQEGQFEIPRENINLE